MAERPAFLTNSLIVAAHPDDELLWFNAILPQVDEVIVVYRAFWANPEIGDKRSAALAAFPRPGVSCLDVAESGAYGCANWLDPVESPFGLELSFESQMREWKRLTKLALSKVGVTPLRISERSIMEAYQRNFEVISERLRPRLHRDMNVFTHNPWGEYGHEEHVQVFRVLQNLQTEIGFKLWMSNYCTDRSLPLAMRYFERAPGPYIRLPTDTAFAEQVADVYKKHDCWTWADDWSWFPDECYMPAPMAGTTPRSHQHLFPLNLFTIDAKRNVNWVPRAIGLSAASAALVAIVDI